MSTYKDLARERHHLRSLLEFVTCHWCASMLQDPSRKLCAYDFATDSWNCSEEHLAATQREHSSGRGVYSAAHDDHA